MDGSHPHWLAAGENTGDERGPATSRAEAQAFERAVMPLLPAMRASALRLTRNPADADDLVQESLLRAYRFWSSYREGTHLAAWLNRIVRNTFINNYRRARRERLAMGSLRSLALARHDHAPTQSPADHGFSDGVEAALQRVPPEFRAVLLEVAVNDRSYNEAAETLGCPVGTVMSRLHRARRALAPALSEYAQAQGVVG